MATPSQTALTKVVRRPELVNMKRLQTSFACMAMGSHDNNWQAPLWKSQATPFQTVRSGVGRGVCVPSLQPVAVGVPEKPACPGVFASLSSSL